MQLFYGALNFSCYYWMDRKGSIVAKFSCTLLLPMTYHNHIMWKNHSWRKSPFDPGVERISTGEISSCAQVKEIFPSNYAFWDGCLWNLKRDYGTDTYSISDCWHKPDLSEWTYFRFWNKDTKPIFPLFYYVANYFIMIRKIHKRTTLQA